MFKRILSSILARVSHRTAGLAFFLALSLPLNHTHHTSHTSHNTPVSHPQSNPIKLPEKQSYYIIAYDPQEKQILQAIQTILTTEPYPVIIMDKHQYQQTFNQDLTESVSVFFKSHYLPHKLKLDFDKGEMTAQAHNIQNFISYIKTDDLRKLSKEALEDFDNPLMVVDVYSNEGEKMLVEQILILAELRILNPLHNRVNIVRHANQQKANTYHILRNDILMQMQNMDSSQNLNHSFETFNNPTNSLEESVKKARVQFLEFLLPRIHTIRSFDDYFLYDQRTQQINPEKYTVSVNILPHDPLSREKLSVLHEIYKKHSSDFNFVIFSTTKMKSMIVHTTKDGEDFVLFDLNRPIPCNMLKRGAYSKLFLGTYNPNQSIQTNLQMVLQNIDAFLRKEKSADELNIVPSEKNFEINLTILKKLLADRKGNPFILGVCEKLCRDKKKSLDMNYWIDSSIHNLGIRAETYLRVDPEKQIVEDSS